MLHYTDRHTHSPRYFTHRQTHKHTNHTTLHRQTDIQTTLHYTQTDRQTHRPCYNTQTETQTHRPRHITRSHTYHITSHTDRHTHRPRGELDATVMPRPFATDQTLTTLSLDASMCFSVFGSEVGPLGPTRCIVALGLGHVAPNTEEPRDNKHNVASEVSSQCDDRLTMSRSS